MKALISSSCAAAIFLTGCAQYDDGYADLTPSRGIYAESWLYANNAADYPSQRRLRSERIIHERREPREITRTQEAMAMRQVALRNQQRGANFEALAYNNNSIPQPSGSVSTAFAIDEAGQELAAPLPIAERTNINSTPIATPVSGRPGYVVSPYAPGAGYIDVTGLPTGADARDPYTGRIFKVP